MTKTLAAALCAIALGGCADKVVPISVSVLTKKCGTGSAPAPTDGVDHYQVTVSASDLASPIVQTFAAGSAVTLDKIPPGKARVMTLVGYHGDPTNNAGVVKAYGQSAPFDVPDDASANVKVTIVLKIAGAFQGVPTVADPTTCAQLTEPRAGHTATLLADGRVLIVGGYAVNGTVSVDAGLDEANWTVSKSAEIFDPKTNSVTSVAPMTAEVPVVFPDGGTASNLYDSPATFHTASLLPSNQVLVAGGEDVRSQIVFTRFNTMLYDVGSDAWTYGYVEAPEYDYPDGGQYLIKRSRGQAVSDATGFVTYFGGVRDDGDPATEVVRFDPNAFTFHAVKDVDGTSVPSLALVDAAGSPAQSANYAVGAGGVNADGLTQQPVVAFGFNQAGDWGILGYKVPSPTPSTGDGVIPVTRASVAPIGQNTLQVLVAGGLLGDGGYAQAQVVDLEPGVDAKNLTFPANNEGRASPCAAALADGRVLVIGGELPGQKTSDLVDLFTPSDTGATVTSAGTLLDSRAQQTCTVLQDGSVLVTGGISYDRSAKTFKVLQSIEIYTPVPAQ